MECIYTLEDVIEAFGMKEKTILDWIQHGKFKGIKNIDNKLFFNSESKLISIHGKQILVKDIIAAHKKLNENLIDMETYAYDNIMWSIVYYLQDKYGGVYEETLKNKVNKNWEEKEDEKMWIYYLSKIKSNEEIEN